MSTNTTPLYRVFLSSTAIDLKAHRQKVKDAILMMGDLPVAMETFGARPSEPVELCKKKVRESDAVCVFLAHRYGWVPGVEEGGDGHKSITWIEMETAVAEGKPVFAFIVDESYKWGQPKEQDLLVQAKDEKEAAGVFRKVQALKKFRKQLEGQVRVTFTNPDDLATKVVASLTSFIRDKKASGAELGQTRKRPPVFREVHPLQPATHFRGRKALLKDFTDWWNDPLSADRVRSLIAIGGTGKTALIQHFLAHSIDQRKLKGSVLVWSFYENPNTDAFLEEALNVFAGESGDNQGLGGRLPRLQRALSEGDQPHLLVLDGLERVQSEGGSGRAWGELENHRIKNLLRTIAGGLGKTRAIITSRFKLTDLAQWEHRGYRGIALDTLEKEGAISLLRAWGVKGDDEELSVLAESSGMHALTVSVIGSYLKNYCNGELTGAAQFQLDDASMDDSQAAKLGRILAGYAQQLSTNERDLLIRLSIFPKGISVEILRIIIIAGGEIAGTLRGVKEPQLLRLAKRLETLGLVYTYQHRNSIIYTAHPFLREYFRQLLGVPPEEIHETVRGKLAVGLETKPDIKPTDAETLDRYEALIEQTVLAGQIDEANKLYFNVMGGGGGGGHHLYHRTGDYGRILRIVSIFSEDSQPKSLGLSLTENDRAYLINAWGLAALALGDTILAKECFDIAKELYRKTKYRLGVSQMLQNIAWVRIYRGTFIYAKKLLDESLEYLGEDDSVYLRRASYGYLGYSYYNLGAILKAKSCFSKSTEILGSTLHGLGSIYESEYLNKIGEKQEAYDRVIRNLDLSERNGWQKITMLCFNLLGMFSLPDYIGEAREYLNKALQWPSQSGDMECLIRNHILAAEIAICSGDLDAAIAEATTGLNQAETCGYGKFAIDLLIQLARIHLAIPDPGTALTYARRALDWSSREEVRYAWGIADAAELCGKCHEELGEYDLAKRRFAEAEVAREPLHL